MEVVRLLKGAFSELAPKITLWQNDPDPWSSTTRCMFELDTMLVAVSVRDKERFKDDTWEERLRHEFLAVGLNLDLTNRYTMKH